ncbi:Hydrogenase transcriptional regulatory protein hupR1 [Botrimarina colliarenosi]|uniref:Hydrogenase transcriptional regulatory protein hupR1 n=1 Tax=Botrimarina colliarenosi TaxID=2528001 RepID=A0A5C6AI51_9BACT|nr:HD domain-containing phosphohydrolase [Botrimarina colliarenosi]TWT99309.1 Hydrogenase transcriptional regulatory protein hupR1 [Botrimarina colliarenosi]
MTPPERVLLVDDDPNVLKAYERRLRRRFDVETALCSEEGVTAVNFLGPFAVIVSDMTMPREDGAGFLARMLELSPDSIRIMLTGNADQATAVKAVNVARVFRFLNKPCQADELELAIQDGIDEHRRLRAERELMAQTVHGVVSMLTHVLSLVNPSAFGRATRLRSLAREVADAIEIADPWELEIAASLSQLGAVTMTDALLQKLGREDPLTDAEQILVSQQYRIAADLIGEAPRLESIARAVVLQSDDESPTESDSVNVRRNASLLAVVLEFDHLTTDRGLPRADALHQIVSHAPNSAEIAIEALQKVVARHDTRRSMEVTLADLRDGMYLVEDVETTSGIVLVARGHEVTASLRGRLTSYGATHDLKLPIPVLVAADMADKIAAQRIGV